MSDIISRQDAIDTVLTMFDRCDGDINDYRDLLVESFKVLPSQERKTGKWIDETFKPWGLVHHPYKCNQCGENSEADSDFCPNCGADMRRRRT